MTHTIYRILFNTVRTGNIIKKHLGWLVVWGAIIGSGIGFVFSLNQ